MTDPDDLSSAQGEILIYPGSEGLSRVTCRFVDGSLWLSQAAMVDLYQSSKANISKHLVNIFEDGELSEDSVVNFYLTTAADGKAYRVKHYKLEVVIAVGYRVRSQRGTQFRQWATARLEEYLRKGFVMDDERLKNPPGPGVPDYFDEMLERIRDIRSSEKRMYLRVREIFAMAADYEAASSELRFKRLCSSRSDGVSVAGGFNPRCIRDGAWRRDSDAVTDALTQAWRLYGAHMSSCRFATAISS